MVMSYGYDDIEIDNATKEQLCRNPFQQPRWRASVMPSTSADIIGPELC